jgi:hypothetical protein
MRPRIAVLVLTLALAAIAPGVLAAEPPTPNGPTPNGPTPNGPTPDGPVKVWLGPEGEKITVVPLKPAARNLVAIKFENVEGPWNGKVLRHRREIMGADREDYPLDNAGSRYVSLTLRHGRWTAYPDAAPREIELRYSRKDSEQADPAQVARELTSAGSDK